MFTHGAVMFTPPEAVVYHLWSRDHRPQYSQDSNNEQEAKATRRAHSQHLVRELLNADMKSNNTRYTVISLYVVMTDVFDNYSIIQECVEVSVG